MFGFLQRNTGGIRPVMSNLLDGPEPGKFGALSTRILGPLPVGKALSENLTLLPAVWRTESVDYHNYSQSTWNCRYGVPCSSLPEGGLPMDYQPLSMH